MIIKENKLFFIHIPKTAGSSIEKAVNGDNPLWGRHFNFDRFIQCNYQPSEYFIFTVVRNPWDRIYSCFSWLKSIKSPKSSWCENFDEYLLYVESYQSGQPNPDYFLENFNWWTGGFKNLDFIIKYEDLDQDIEEFSAEIGLDIKLPHLNRNPDKDPAVSYRNFYSPKGAEIISKKYNDEIKLFGYSF